jgi:hypothetical protein
VLNCQAHDIPALVNARLLKALGNPTQNGAKYFATADVLEKAKDSSWLVKVSNTISQHWQHQNARKSDATTERRQRDAQIASITDRRLTIQFAADAEWPYTVDTNAGIRSEFYLPASQPFHG